MGRHGYLTAVASWGWLCRSYALPKEAEVALDEAEKGES